MSDTPRLGIDFGTSNSCMAALDGGGNPDVILTPWGENKVPSLVYFGPNGIRVGRDAWELWQRGEELPRLVTSPKLRLTKKGGVLVNGKPYSYLDAAVEILRFLKNHAEREHFHGPVKRAVVGHPVVFTKKEKQTLEKAACQAGFEEVDLVAEPVAAALAYAYAGVDPGQGVMVYDLGGGTFDLAVVRRHGDTYQVALPPKGEKLGGDDFDQAIYDYCLHHWGLPQPKQRHLALLLACRKAKEALSHKESEEIFFYHQGKQHTLELTRLKLEELLRPLVQKTLALVRQMLQEAGSKKQKIDSLILIGGSTRLSFIEEALRRELSGLRVLRWAKKDVAVALGTVLEGQSRRPPEPKSRPAPPEWYEEKFIFEPSLDAVKGYLWVGDFYEGKSAYKEKAWNKAKQYFSRILEENPREPHALFARARCLFHQKKYQEALADLNAVLELEADNLGPGPRLWRAIASEKCPGKSTLLKDLHQALKLFHEKGNQDSPLARTTAYLLFIFALHDGHEAHYRVALGALLEGRFSVAKLHKPLCRLFELDTKPQASLKNLPTLLLFWLLWARDQGSLSRRQAQEVLETVCVHADYIRKLSSKFCELFGRLGQPAAETLADLAGLAAKHHRPNLAVELMESLCEKCPAGSEFDILLSVPDLVLSGKGQVKELLIPSISLDFKKRTHSFTKIGLFENKVYTVHTEYEPVVTNRGLFALHDVEIPLRVGNGVSVVIRIDKLSAGAKKEIDIYVWKKQYSQSTANYNSREKRLLEQKRKEYAQRPPTPGKQGPASRSGVQQADKKQSQKTRTSPQGRSREKVAVRLLHQVAVSPHRRVHSVAFSPDGKHVLTGSNDKTAVLWDTQTGEKIRTFAGHTHWVQSVAFSPDGKYVLTGSDDKTAALWDAQAGEKLRTFAGHTDWVLSVAFSPDGKYVLTGSNDKTAVLWDAQTGEKIRTFAGHTDWVLSVAFSPDGKYVLTGSGDKTVVLWDAQAGWKLRIFKGHTDWVRSVAFSPDGKYVLTGSDDKTAALWDARAGEKLRIFKGHTRWVRSVAFSPDGKYVLTGSADKTAVLWDAQTGEEIHKFQGDSPVYSVAFGPDGRLIALALDNGSVELWQLERSQG